MTFFKNHKILVGMLVIALIIIAVWFYQNYQDDAITTAENKTKEPFKIPSVDRNEVVQVANPTPTGTVVTNTTGTTDNLNAVPSGTGSKGNVEYSTPFGSLMR